MMSHFLWLILSSTCDYTQFYKFLSIVIGAYQVSPIRLSLTARFRQFIFLQFKLHYPFGKSQLLRPWNSNYDLCNTIKFLISLQKLSARERTKNFILRRGILFLLGRGDSALKFERKTKERRYFNGINKIKSIFW